MLSPVRVFITGGTGLIGARLVADRLARGDELCLLTRDAAAARRKLAGPGSGRLDFVEGDATAGGDWTRAIVGCDAAVHLAGAGVADRRWTKAYKDQIVASRVDSTRHVVDAIAQARAAPRVLVSASAIGYYGATGDQAADESAAPARGDFFGDLCVRWEEAARRAEALGARVACLRTGVVLDERGGILQSMRRPFLLFAGGPLGGGRQFVSWIHWRDVVGIVDLALRDGSARGGLNATAPSPVRAAEFARALGRAMHRPSWLPVPAPVARIALGEFARYALMSQRVVPARALALGYRFEHAEIQGALDAILAIRTTRTPR
jgi:hypothetical protein